MQFVYIVGAQCTGKTTLSEAFAAAIKTNNPNLKCELLQETARNTLQLHGFTRSDVRNGGDRCLELQRLIMQSQFERETTAKHCDLNLVVSDRSGIDPLAYASMYCGSALSHGLQEAAVWAELRSNLRAGVVVLCEPVQEWLFDDGTRLVPLNWEEWMETHRTFCTLLEQHDVDYIVLPASIPALKDRVDFMLSHCKVKTLPLPVKGYVREKWQGSHLVD